MNEAHPNGYMIREVGKLLDEAVRFLQGLEVYPHDDSEFNALRVEARGTIRVLRRALEDLNQLAERFERVIKEVNACR